ncbi:hypothetical protein ERO13_D03G000201v2 [Gossypium hirsutum]|uniref:Uncharacterized protein n=2 Tax=Gossypium TaxID=3633 RepID=A0A0D2NU30_GOSRA|nr:hypothetical protein ES319_D03G000100v1 [Gossypium barbadense]KAG4153593.1 hypothetical protein ERO13_D03G000201v2 [Gossypium hirsutum]KJB17423.1 hypothetical protein B456_003G000500 [Gossypium raimondii]
MHQWILLKLMGGISDTYNEFFWVLSQWYLLMFADQISSIFWILHSDLHEARVTAVLEYLLSLVASLEPSH